MPYKDKQKQREAAKRHYERNREAYAARAKIWTKQNIELINNWLLEYLNNHPCVDCSESDIIVLEFDHKDPKSKKFAIKEFRVFGYSLNTVKLEVEKCDVRCANCHRRRHYYERLL